MEENKKSLVELLKDINPDYDETELENYMKEHPDEVIDEMDD